MGIEIGDLDPQNLATRPTLAQRATWWLKDSAKHLARHRRAMWAVISGIVLLLSAVGYGWLFVFQYIPQDSWSQDLVGAGNQPLGRLIVTYPRSLAPGAEDIITVRLGMTNTMSVGTYLDVDLRSDMYSSTGGDIDPYVEHFDLSESIQRTKNIDIRAGRLSFFSNGVIILRVQTQLSTGLTEVMTVPILVRSGWVHLLVIPTILGFLGLVITTCGHKLLASLSKPS